MPVSNIFEEKRNIVIFGQGIIGQNFHRKYFDDLNFLLYCDNDPKKHNTRCFGLNVISLDELLNFSDFVVVICVRKHYEVAQQLFNMGIKSFWLNMEGNGFIPAFMDFSGYDNLAYNPRRVCLIEYLGAGGNCYAIKKLAQANDIDFMLIDSVSDIFKNAFAYYAFHTSALAVTQGMDSTYGKPRIEMWHGFPIKALFFASFDHKNIEFTPLVNTMLNESSALCSYSKLYNIFFSYCGGCVDIKKFTITGMPRNDLLQKSDGRKIMRLFFSGINTSKVVLYSPTFRESKYYDYHNLKDGLIFAWPDFDINALEAYLAERNIVLIIKVHSAELTKYKIVETVHVKILHSENLLEHNIHLYELLGSVDLLISDYSSIWVDFLLLNKPIVFAVKDLEQYATIHGLMAEPFEAWAPGAICKDMNSLMESINNAVLGEDLFSEKRNFLKGILHHYSDFESTNRVVKLISSILA